MAAALVAPFVLPTSAMADVTAGARAEVLESRVLAPAPHTAHFSAAPPGTSVVLVEGATGQVIAELDGDRRRPIASAIKLVTALTVIDAFPQGSVVTVGEEVIGVEGSSYGLRPGEVRSVEDLLAGLLLRSGNDVAVTLAHAVAGSEEAFAILMAGSLRDLGIDATPVSASGLQPGDALSAAELAVVSRAALAEPRIRRIAGLAELRGESGTLLQNRNLFVGQFEGATGLKTGFTSIAGYTLSASAQRDGRELIAVVLGAPDDAARRASAARLLDYGFTSTTLRSVDRSITLRTSRGPVRFGTEGVSVTVANASEIRATWAPTLRPDDTPAAVEVLVDDRPSGRAQVTRRDARDGSGGGGLGAALADGAYAAFRPFGIDEALR